MKKSCLEFNTSQKWEADVCVMGAGVAGITLANELRQQGLSVVLLEAGGEKHDAGVQEIARAVSVSKSYPDPSQSRLRMLGGTSNHWANNTSPLSAIDFEAREGLANTGWPISLSDLEPYYQQAAIYCGTGDDGYDLNHWHNVFGTSPTIGPGDRERLTLAIAKAAVPPTRFFIQHGMPLVNDDNVTLLTHAQVTNIHFDANSKRVDGVTLVGPNGMSHQVNARETIMAFGGIENARMLLHFNQQHNNQIGNQFDSVGRYFMDHPTLRGAQVYTAIPEAFNLFKGAMTDDYRRFVLNFFELTANTLRDEQLTNLRLPLTPATRQQMSHGISSFHLLRERLSGKQVSGDLASQLTHLVMDLDVVADTISRKTFDAPLFSGAQDFGGFEVPMMMEQLPHRDNRIYLSDKKDRYGIPQLSIDWQLHQSDRNRLWRGIEVFASELGGLGLGRVRSLRDRASRLFEDQIGFGHHHMGTTRMSSTPEDGVVDFEQKVFGTLNFSVAGCSVFATGSHVPPTLTIAATSIRLAKIITDRLGTASQI